MKFHTKSHKLLRSRIRPMLLIPTLVFGLLPAWAGAATLVVTTTADSGVGGCTPDGDGDGCTLREAIIAANNETLTPGSDTIDATGVNGTITLQQALPPLSTLIEINGPGADILTVARSSAGGTPEFRIFSVDNNSTSGPTVGISGFTISGGKVSGSTAPDNSGGAIYNNHGTLTVDDCVLTNNSATHGGALSNDGSVSKNAILTLSNSSITDNIATGDGGGLFNNGSGGGSAPLTISNSTFARNSAVNGGAILNDGHAGGSATITELSSSVLSDNTATGDGGAIKNYGTAGGSATLVISYSTVSGNSAVNGGAIDNDGVGGSATQVITYSTFNANTASENGGAINNDGRIAGSATLAVRTSTFHGNTATNKGGAINNDGALSNDGAGGSATVSFDSSTLKANTASVDSAAIDSDGTAGSATLALGSTILDNGSTDNLKLTTNSETTFTSKNYNLSSDAAGGDNTTGPGGPYLNAGGDVRNTDPLLDPAGLMDNGGQTETVALMEGSPAIDQGKNIGTATDQRGMMRPNDIASINNVPGGDGSDVGAFELQTLPNAIEPIIDLNGSGGNDGIDFAATFTQGAGAANLTDTDAIISDLESISLQSLTISLGDTFQTGDTLDADVTGDGVVLTKSYNALTGVLTLSGVDTIEHYQQVLRTVTFNSLVNPLDTTERTIDFVATDTEDNASNVATTTLTIVPMDASNSAPVLAAIGDREVTEGEELSFTASATDADDDALTYSLADGTSTTPNVSNTVPTGASINPTTGAFSWTPDQTQGPGTYSFKIVVEDDGGVDNDGEPLSDFEEIVVTVKEDNAPPTFTSPGDKEVNEGSNLSFNLEASDEDEGQTLTYSATGLPAGATLDPETGAFSWTPTEAQGGMQYSITFTVSDGNSGGETSHTITITVNKVNSAPVLAAIGDKNVNEGSLLSFTATATDSDLPANTLTFSLVGAPAGASITSNGNFTWTPSEAQGPATYTFAVKVSDGTDSDEESITVTVAEVNNAAPVLPFVGARTLFFGSTTTYNFAATDADLPGNTLAYSLIGAPSGATIDSAGVFRWTPTAAQATLNNFYSFKVRVTDNGVPAKSDEETASFTVLYPAQISINSTNPSVKADNASKSVTFIYTVRNNTSVAQSNLKVQGDVFWPAALQSVELTAAAGTTASQSTLTASSRRVTWNIPSLAAGASKTLSVKLTGVVPTTAPQKSRIASGFVLSPVSGTSVPNHTAPEVFLNTFK